MRILPFLAAVAAVSACYISTFWHGVEVTADLRGAAGIAALEAH